ncbi:MAG: ComEA family DNA-binding protein [Chloroflexales bacterium]
MSEGVIWWRRPRLLAAVACVMIGLAIMVGGPALRGAVTPTVPTPVNDLGSAFLDVPEDPTPSVVSESPAPVELIVYVSGAVAVPDVYRLPEGARVKDAVLAAGGLRGDAASENVNLAAPLSDAQHVHVPHIGEAALPADPSASAPAGQPTSGGLINLNQANTTDLEELPGVGQAIAARIVAYRTQQGSFQSVEDLQNVTGIGAKLFAKISPLVTVGP